MEIRPLTAADHRAWSELLALSFDRSPAQMVALLTHLQRTGLVAWGAWDGDQLAAQYSCLLADLRLPDVAQPVQVGISINMAVHPDYRGRGLVKKVAQPVYDTLTQCGVLAGVGFSNAEGVKVDQRSKGYGYQIIGQLQPLVARIRPFPTAVPLSLTDQLPNSLSISTPVSQIAFDTTIQGLHRRYGEHPFRCYRFAVWEETGQVCGIVIYRPMKLLGIPAVALLGAYSDYLPTLLNGWLDAMYGQGYRLAHCLTSPAAPLRQQLQRLTLTFTPPYKRTPYYLTAKPLQPDLPADFLCFEQWNCVGGDVR